MNEPTYKVDNIFLWRIRKIKNKIFREFLVLWAGYPLEKATWDPEDTFLAKKNYMETLTVDACPKENKYSNSFSLRTKLFKRGVVVALQPRLGNFGAEEKVFV